MDLAACSVELTRLRVRVDELAHRRQAALERLAPQSDSPSRRQLEAMRFELAELEWQLTDLEATV
jgi:hypothetical protein